MLGEVTQETVILFLIMELAIVIIKIVKCPHTPDSTNPGNVYMIE